MNGARIGARDGAMQRNARDRAHWKCVCNAFDFGHFCWSAFVRSTILSRVLERPPFGCVSSVERSRIRWRWRLRTLSTAFPADEVARSIAVEARRRRLGMCIAM
jgi:hypothetical protein